MTGKKRGGDVLELEYVSYVGRKLPLLRKPRHAHQVSRQCDTEGYAVWTCHGYHGDGTYVV